MANSLKSLKLFNSYAIRANQLQKQTTASQTKTVEFTSQLEKVYSILNQNFQHILSNPHIQYDDFDELSYQTSHKAHFKKALAIKLNKTHLTWELSAKERAFRMLAEHVRQTFKSLLYKQKITQILEEYHFDLSFEKAIRAQLTQAKLFPTFAELRNLWRSQNTEKQAIDFNQFNLVLDYSTQDSATVRQESPLHPVYELQDFQGNWTKLDFSSYLPAFFINKARKLQEKGLFVKYNKPKFLKNPQGEWEIVITFEFKPEVKLPSSRSLKFLKQLTCGIDLGQVNPIYGVIIENTNKNRHRVVGKISCKKETQRINQKLNKVKTNLQRVYSKLHHYQKVLSRFDEGFYADLENQNPSSFSRITFLIDLQGKQKRLLLEKQYLRRKCKELKKRLAFLATRDVVKQLEKYQVNTVNVEQLNWLESQAGKWNFSTFQTILENKLAEKAIVLQKVNACMTSRQNPFRQKNQYGKAKTNRQVEFETSKGAYLLDRDELAAINIALRGREKELKTKIKQTIDFNQTKKQKRIQLTQTKF